MDKEVYTRGKWKQPTKSQLKAGDVFLKMHKNSKSKVPSIPLGQIKKD